MTDETDMIELENERIRRVQEAGSRDLDGSLSRAAQSRNLAIEAGESSTANLVGRAAFSGSNLIGSAWDYLGRKFIPSDPNFNFDDHKAELLSGIDASVYVDALRNTSSLEEARALKADILEGQHDLAVLGSAGVRGQAAQLLAGTLDVDTALTVLSGGSLVGAKFARSIGPLARTRVGAAAAMGLEGAAASAIVSGGLAVTDPNASIEDVPHAVLGGFVFGSVIGGVTKADLAAQSGVRSTRQEMQDTSAERYSPNRINNYLTANAEERIDRSIGAASIGMTQAQRDALADSPRALELVEDAHIYSAQHNLVGKQNSAFADNIVGKSAKYLYDAVRKSPIASDFDRMWNSNSVLATVLMHKLGESPIGLVRNNTSADSLGRQYHTSIMRPVADAYQNSFRMWLREEGITTNPVLAAMQGDVVRKFHYDMEMARLDRYFDQTMKSGRDSFDTYLDARDIANKRAVEIQKGRAGENPMHGSEDLEHVPGWGRQLIDGRKLMQTVQSITAQLGRNGRDVILDTLATNYTRIDGLTPEHAMQYARSVLRRAEANERGIETNLIAMLRYEGEEFFRTYMRDNGFTDKDIDSVITGMRGKEADRGKPGYLKARRDVDLRTVIPGTNHRLLDLYDTDILRVHADYARSVSMNAATARQGIQPSDWGDIKAAIKQEELANGGRTLSDEQLDAIEHMFRGRPLSGGLDPWVRRALAVTRLATLNGVGLTQLAETGVAIAAVGFESWAASAPRAFTDMMKGKKSLAMRQLADVSSAIAGEHNIIRADLMLDEMTANPGAMAELGMFVDKLLVRGQRAQGHVSGFFKVMEIQHSIAGRALLHRLGRMFKDGKAMSQGRLNDLGLDPKLQRNIQKYFTDGTVKYHPDGSVADLGISKWKGTDATEFASVMNRFTDQVIQKARMGESTYWFHKDVGAIFVSLKSFPLLALQKQLLRNARLADSEAAMAFMYSMLAAGVVYTAAQASKGKADDLDALSIMKGAFGLSNLTGVIPMFTDPVASMLGQDDWRFNQYGTRGGYGGDIISTPAPLPTLNRVAHVPESAAYLLTGNGDIGDVSALQATPLIGNLYGFSYMFNAMKDSMRKEREAQRRSARQPQEDSAPAQEPEYNIQESGGLTGISAENAEALNSLMNN